MLYAFIPPTKKYGMWKLKTSRAKYRKDHNQKEK